MPEERFPPIPRVELAEAVVTILVRRDAVVEPAVEERQRNVVIDIEGSIVVVAAPARQPESALLAFVSVNPGVMDRHQANHPLIDVRAGMPLEMIVEPPERLLFVRIGFARQRVGRGHVEIQVVYPLLRLESLRTMMRVAVAFGRGVRVVQVYEKFAVGRTEIAGVELLRVLVKVILEANEHRAAVVGSDHRAGKCRASSFGQRTTSAVESVDHARRKRLFTLRTAGRNHLVARRIDRQHFAACERVFVYVQTNLIDDRIR
jgi:hypothetical protein